MNWFRRLRSAPIPLLVMLGVLFLQLLVLVLETKPWNVDLFSRLAAGERVGFRDFYAAGMWIGTLLSFLILGFLAATYRWWSGENRVSPPEDVVGFRKLLTGPVCLGLGLAILLGAWDRAPRLTHSLTNDEEYSMRSYVMGSYQVEEDGSLRHRPIRFRDTFFDSPRAANHTLYSLSARIGLALTNPFLATEQQPWSEAGLRLPAFMAGLLAIGCMGLLLAAAGYPGAGIAAAFLLALHPWHLRYAVEARGYSFLILFFLIALMALILALRTNAWRHWLLYGVAQCLYLMSFLASVYLAVTVNLLALAVILFLSGSLSGMGTRLVRWGVVNLLGAALFLQLQTVQLLQLRTSVGEQFRGGMEAGPWFVDLWQHMISGVRGAADDPEFPMYLALDNLTRDSFLMQTYFGWVIPVLVLIGAVTLAFRSPILAIAVWAPPLATLLAFGHATVSGTFIFGWYCIYVLVAFVVAYVMGLDGLGRLAPATSRRWSVPLLLAGGVLLFAVATAFPRSAIRDHPRQPLREAVELARGDQFPAYLPEGANLTTVSFGVSARQLQAYDPRIYPLDRSSEENLRALEDLMSQAREAGTEMVVIYGGRNLVEQSNPELLELVEESGEFSPVGMVPGLEKMMSFHVARFHGGE